MYNNKRTAVLSFVDVKGSLISQTEIFIEGSPEFYFGEGALNNMQVKHLPGEHNQKTHGHSTLIRETELSKKYKVSLADFRDVAEGLLQQSDVKYEKVLDFMDNLLTRQPKLVVKPLEDSLITVKAGGYRFVIEVPYLPVNAAHPVRPDRLDILINSISNSIDAKAAADTMRYLEDQAGSLKYRLRTTIGKYGLPLNYAASRGYKISSNFFKHSENIKKIFEKLKEEYEFKYTDEDVTNIVKKFQPIVYMSIKDLIAIKHPHYPDVELFTEYISSNLHLYVERDPQPSAQG